MTQASTINEAAQREAEKWAIFRSQIDRGCWEQVGQDGPGAVLCRLKTDWLRALFDPSYEALRVNADPQLENLRAISFLKANGVHEVRVASRLRPGNVYDFRWAFRRALPDDDAAVRCGNLEHRAIQIERTDGSNRTGTANVVWLLAPGTIELPIPPQEMKVRLYCQEIDETIDLNLADLTVRYHEGAGEQQMRAQEQQRRIQAQQAQAQAQILPWRHVLFWMGHLRQVDRVAYGRVPKPIKAFLDGGNSFFRVGDPIDRVNSLSMNDIVAWQRQGVLPPALPIMTADDIEELRASVVTQQGLSTQQQVLILFNNVSPFPPLLLKVNAAQLQPFDLQAFMTIGALREIHGFLETQMQELMKNDPKFRALMNSPQGTRQLLQQDPKFAAFRAHPLVIKELQDLEDIQMRRGCNYGPTGREMMRMMQAQQTGMANAMGWGMLDPMLGMAASLQSMQGQASPPPQPGSPPWKLYEPYLC